MGSHYTIWVNPSANPKVLKPGVYCATGSSGKIKIGDSNVVGTGVTLVASNYIELSGSNINLTPPTTGFTAGVLMVSWGNSADAIKHNGSNIQWSGLVFAPNGRADIGGSSGLTILGSIIANTVSLGGSNIKLTGTVGDKNVSQLVE